MQDKRPTAVLVRRARAGDEHAFSRLVRDFQDMAVGYAVTLTGDFHLAEDAAQEAFVAAHRQLDDLNEDAAFPGWFRMLVRTACSRITRRKRLDTVPIDSVQVVGEDAGAREENEVSESILKTVWDLPEAERSVITLTYVSKYTHQEVADFLGVPVTTVQGRLRTGRERLKDRMLTMAKNELNAHAPSRDSSFVDRVKRLTRPEQLNTDDEAEWSGGRGNDVWAMIKASIEGDLKAMKALVDRDPRLVTSSFQYRPPLHFAVQENHLDVAEFLLSNGADATLQSGNPWHAAPLVIAEERGHTEMANLLRSHIEQSQGATEVNDEVSEVIRSRDFDRIKAMFEADPELIEAVDGRGNKAIHWASLTRQIKVIDLLLNLGADVNAMRPDGARPLDLTNGDYWYRQKRDMPATAVSSHEVVLGYLVGRGADYDIAVAAKVGDTERVRDILDADPDLVNKVPAYSTWYTGFPLRNAAAANDEETVTLLLERGADPRTPEPGIAPTGRALNAAAGQGNLKIARMLLERGADPNGSVESSGTCMTSARDNIEMIRLLAEYGGTYPDWTDLNDVPPEAIEAVYGDTPPFRYLVDVEDLDSLKERFVQDPGVVNEVLQYSVRGYFGVKKDVIKLCLETDPDAAKSLHAFTLVYLLHRVGEEKLIEPFRWLLEAGMTPNDSNWMRVTALHRLTLGNTNHGTSGEKYEPYSNVARLFIEHGADLEARDEEYLSTPLGWAARWGRKEMVELLLERGAKVKPDGCPDWAMPLAWAENKGHAEIANMLRQAGA